MEIRCTHCQHVGPAARVEPGVAGVMLICGHCGEGNLLELSAESSPANDAPQAEAMVSEAVPDFSAPKREALPVSRSVVTQAALPDVAGDIKEPLLTPKALKRLVPVYGEGLRCRKCAHKVEPYHEHCARCGLDIEDSFRYAPGEAPWELAPKGSGQAWERARLLWEVAEQDWNPENVAKFAHFVRDEGFNEMGIRRLRFFLVEHPDDPLALTHLQELAMRMQSRLIVARAQAEVSAQKLSSGLKRTRTVLMWGVVVGWSIIFILFLGRFMDNCG